VPTRGTGSCRSELPDLAAKPPMRPPPRYPAPPEDHAFQGHPANPIGDPATHEEAPADPAARGEGPTATVYRAGLARRRREMWRGEGVAVAQGFARVAPGSDAGSGYLVLSGLLDSLSICFFYSLSVCWYDWL
jgi:hypothetical protein